MRPKALVAIGLSTAAITSLVVYYVAVMQRQKVESLDALKGRSYEQIVETLGPPLYGDEVSYNSLGTALTLPVREFIEKNGVDKSATIWAVRWKDGDYFIDAWLIQGADGHRSVCDAVRWHKSVQF